MDYLGENRLVGRLKKQFLNQALSSDLLRLGQEFQCAGVQEHIQSLPKFLLGLVDRQHDRLFPVMGFQVRFRLLVVFQEQSVPLIHLQE